MERRTTLVAERLRQFTRLGEYDSDGKVSLSKEVATILEDLCGEAADMITDMREQIDKGTVITAYPSYPPFGSIGDSVDIDEILKQTKTTAPEVQDVSSCSTANPTYGDNCWARLPCGLCSRTMAHCPMSVLTPAWPYTTACGDTGTGGTT